MQPALVSERARIPSSPAFLCTDGIGIPGQDGVPKGLVNNHWATFWSSPRFCQDVTGAGKTVIRGGFGIMYERIQGNDMQRRSQYSVQSPGEPTFVTMQNPSIATANGNPVILPINPAGITGLDVSDYKPPVSYQWGASAYNTKLERSRCCR